MKDEIFELLAPELLEKYRRWRPYQVGLQALVVAMAVAGFVVMYVDCGKYCANGGVAAGLIYGGMVIRIGQLIWNRRLTRGLSGMGVGLGTKLQRYLTAAWLVLSITGVATIDACYGRPLSNTQTSPTCR